MKQRDPETGDTVYVCCPNCGCDDVGKKQLELAAGMHITLCECRRCTKLFVPLYPPWSTGPTRRKQK